MSTLRRWYEPRRTDESAIEGNSASPSQAPTHTHI